jgi:uncharacterized membrane protein YhaH (DUF805 family)
VAIYDTIRMVPAAAVVARPLAGRSKQEQAALQMWLVLLWLAPWVTQPCAEYMRLQILTVVLAGLGYWALSLARVRPASELPAPKQGEVPDAA